MITDLIIVVSKIQHKAQISPKTKVKELKNFQCYLLAFLDYKTEFLVSFIGVFIWQSLETPLMLTKFWVTQ